MFERRIPDYQGDQKGNLLKMQIWIVFSGFPADVCVTFLELFFPHNILCLGFKGLTDSGVVSCSRNGEKQKAKYAWEFFLTICLYRSYLSLQQ